VLVARYYSLLQATIIGRRQSQAAACRWPTTLARDETTPEAQNGLSVYDSFQSIISQEEWA